MAKPKTNTQMLISLIKENDNKNPILNALLRERIVMIMEMTKLSIDNEPEKWENSIVHHSMYVGLCITVQKYLGFDDYSPVATNEEVED